MFELWALNYWAIYIQAEIGALEYKTANIKINLILQSTVILYNLKQTVQIRIDTAALYC